MKEIYSSATKITLLLLVFGLLYFTGIGVIDQKPFESALIMVISFYFGQKTALPTK